MLFALCVVFVPCLALLVVSRWVHAVVFLCNTEQTVMAVKSDVMVVVSYRCIQPSSMQNVLVHGTEATVAAAARAVRTVKKYS